MIKSLYHGLKTWFNPMKALYWKGVGLTGSHPPPVGDRLLQENGFGILQENGFNILLDLPIPPDNRLLRQNGHSVLLQNGKYILK